MNKLIGIAALLAVLAAPVGATHLPQTEPDSSLSPQDVVSIQIEVLGNGDYASHGAAVVSISHSMHDPHSKYVG